MLKISTACCQIQQLKGEKRWHGKQNFLTLKCVVEEASVVCFLFQKFLLNSLVSFMERKHTHMMAPHPSRDINYLADMSNTNFVIHMVRIKSMPILRKSQSSIVTHELRMT